MVNKYSVVVVVALSSLLSLPANASNYRFIAGDNSVDTQICLSAAMNNKYRMKRYIAWSKNTAKAIANNLVCNDLNIIDFAYKYQAVKTFAHLNRYRSAQYKVSITDIVATNNDSLSPESGLTRIVVTASK
jgi:hypothetical protein